MCWGAWVWASISVWVLLVWFLFYRTAINSFWATSELEPCLWGRIGPKLHNTVTVHKQRCSRVTELVQTEQTELGQKYGPGRLRGAKYQKPLPSRMKYHSAYDSNQNSADAVIWPVLFSPCWLAQQGWFEPIRMRLDRSPAWSLEEGLSS